MIKKPLPVVEVTLDKIVGGGQAIGTLEDGQKIFVWGGLPGEKVTVQVTKKKSKMLQGVVTEVLKPSKQRTEPKDPDSYISTSPWQIMDFEAEQHYKSALVEEAFELHDIVLPNQIKVYSDNNQFGYRNKVEFSWYWNKETEQLDLSFFRRGTHGKIPVEGTSLAHPNINAVGLAFRDILRKAETKAFDLKTLLIRCNSKGQTIAQLYVKNEEFQPISEKSLEKIDNLVGFELIYSEPKSPASVITKRMAKWGIDSLEDIVLDITFNYATEGFFQINLPVYEKALQDMKQWIEDKPVVDLYSGVGTIGLTIGGNNLKLIEINKDAVREMRRNIYSMKREDSVEAILASSESAVEHITNETTVIVDPPRAGLHDNVIDRLLEVTPSRIIYLSCNPATQARDIYKLAEKYGIKHHMGYNFFPRTPHIENLVILELK